MLKVPVSGKRSAHSTIGQSFKPSRASAATFVRFCLVLLSFDRSRQDMGRRPASAAAPIL